MLCGAGVTGSTVSPTALAGARVVELGYGIAGGFGARLLGDLGADVIKLEDPASPDPTRNATPRMGPDGPSALFEFVNWNKRGVTLDVGIGQAERLLRSAEVIIAGLGPDGDRLLGRWDPQTLIDLSPRAVVVQVTSFGATGPYSRWEATDLILHAMSGVMAISGSASHGPLRHGGRTSSFLAGLNVAYAALAGLFSARRTGVGVLIDLAVRDCLSSELVMNHAYHAFVGVVQGPPRNGGDALDGHPVPTGDGYLALQTSARQTPADLVALLDEPELANERFATADGRSRHASALRDVLVRRLRTERALDVFLQASKRGLLAGAVQDADDLLRCPQLDARQVYTEFPELAASGRRWRLPSMLAQLSRTPTAVRRRAPALGAQNAEVTDDGATRLPRDLHPDPLKPDRSAPTEKPLQGIRVLDLSVIFAVPYLGALLADLGAEVIKVESPHRLDQARTDWGGYFDNDPGSEPWNRSGTFQVVNRGKRSFVVDLAVPAGRDLFLALAERSDVVLDNFSPRVLPKLGLTFDRLAQGNPGLVMLSNTGYGSTGPWASFKAQGTSLEATMGLMGVTGHVGGPPTRAGQSVPDFIACWAGLVALLAALVYRQRTGEGQRIDVGMYQLGPTVIPEALISVQADLAPPPRGAASDPDAEISLLVRARDGWLAVAVADRTRLRSLQRLVHGDKHDPIEKLEARLREWAAGQTAMSAAHRLQALRIAVGPVLDAAGLAEDPQLAARGFFEEVVIEQLGESRPLIGRPFRWQSASTRVGIDSGAPSLGADNDYVLRDILGLSEDEICSLRSANVVTETVAEPGPAVAMELAR